MRRHELTRARLNFTRALEELNDRHFEVFVAEENAKHAGVNIYSQTCPVKQEQRDRWVALKESRAALKEAIVAANRAEKSLRHTWQEEHANV